nr:MAG TPA: hypothetical protein [Caudoviricetes sp.]
MLLLYALFSECQWLILHFFQKWSVYNYVKRTRQGFM